jgi:riboflavin synthase alpha subunit
MFTGIVQAKGRIVAAGSGPDGLRLAIAPGHLDTDDIRIGDSVAVNGCCLTVVELRKATDGSSCCSTSPRDDHAYMPPRDRSTSKRRCCSPTGWAAT